jgi:hypothetical protein
MRTITAILLLAICSPAAFGDEGMWTFNDFPSAKVKKAYDFAPDSAWLDHVRLSSVRLAGGCSGSFVSGSGLVMTNHHCAHSCIEQLSTAGKDFVADGFSAATEADEVKCPEIEVNQLVAISDVTDRVNSATKGLEDKEFNERQKAEMSAVEKECDKGDEDVRCDVVTLYNGGKYNLYKYRRYQDVRLVFAPELAIAFFGGDPDNFMFPRYDLDISLLRVYSGGKPLKPDHFFAWSSTGPAGGVREGALTFVTGHPGGSDRLLTVAELEFQRDVSLRKKSLSLSEYRGMLTEFQKRGEEPKRISTAELFMVENSLKSLKGRHEALLDRDFFAGKVSAEKDFRLKVDADPALKKAYGGAWDEIGKAEEIMRGLHVPYVYIEHGIDSTLYGIAKTLVRAAGELPKPSGKRYREFADSHLPALKQELFSTAPVYDDLEIAKLEFSLTKVREELGPDDHFVKKVFGQRSPGELARELVTGTQLKDIEVRRSLFDRGQAAVDASADPMIRLALLIDPDARAIRKRYEDEVEAVLKRSGEKIAKAKFAVYGTSVYPDATFTLRLSYGAVKGYEENGRPVSPVTLMGGAFDRHSGRAPFALPGSWLAAKPRLDLAIPMNICTTNDIIGGNSGSPMIDRDARIVGLVFDGNIHSLGGKYGFDASVNRAVSVHSSALIEALDKVYGAGRLVRELLGNR